MDLSDIIREHSERCIRQRCTEVMKKPALIQFFLNHENLKVTRKNLKHEIFGAELRYGPKMDRARVEKLVEAATDLFMHGALENAIMKTQSAAERKRREDENGREQRAAEFYAEEQKALRSTSISASLHIPDAPKKTPPAGAT